MYYIKTMGYSYLPAIHSDVTPPDVGCTSTKVYREVLARPAAGDPWS